MTSFFLAFLFIHEQKGWERKGWSRALGAAIYQAYSWGSGPCEFTRCLKGVGANLHRLEGGLRIGFARYTA